MVEKLIEVLGKDKVLIGSQLEARYHHIWKMDQPLKVKALLLPRSTEDVSAAMKLCDEHRQPVSIFGGLTNLTGATEVGEEEVVISLEKLNNIIELDAQSRTMTVESGVILESIQAAAAEKDLLFPLNFGAKGSAQIGGIISTNAGGLRVLRYGMTRNLVLGIEAVMADGTIVSGLKKIIKDNTGYDLKQLFIGSEGTLGIVTKAVLRLTESPKSRSSAFVGIDGYEQVIRLLKHLDGGLAGMLSGFELIWSSCYKAMTSPPALMKPPLPYDYEYYVLVESLGSDQENDRSVLETLLEQALEEGMIADAAIAYTQADLSWFWTIREDVHAFISLYEHQQHFDISLPIPLIGETIQETIHQLEQLSGVIRAFAFGHVADGNIHIIVGKENMDADLTSAINDIVYGPLKEIGGSVSAEHGIGIHKKPYLQVSRSSAEINMMKTIKKALDPHNILNRGRILDL